MSEINQEEQVLDNNGYNEELGYENVPVADKGVSNSENFQVDWENETRKFQSMYDKQKAENSKMKQDMEQIAGAINQRQSIVGQQNAQMQEQMLINNTMNDLRNSHKMTESEVREFMEWSTDPGSSMTLDTLVDVFKSKNQQSAVLPSNEPVPSSFEAVQAAKEAPRTAGVLQGQEANQPKSEKDVMWDSILRAGSRSKVL